MTDSDYKKQIIVDSAIISLINKNKRYAVERIIGCDLDSDIWEVLGPSYLKEDVNHILNTNYKSETEFSNDLNTLKSDLDFYNFWD